LSGIDGDHDLFIGDVIHEAYAKPCFSSANRGSARLTAAGDG